MKKCLFPFLFAIASLASNVGAQTPTTPAECYKRCTTLAFEDPELLNNPRFNKKLKEIQAQKKEETEPSKIAELDEDEKAEVEKMKGKLVKSCSKICKYEE
ncbi:MAG: hypothetical protein V4633_19125 [Pseudomonadota bacterium]